MLVIEPLEKGVVKDSQEKKDSEDSISPEFKKWLNEAFDALWPEPSK